MAQDLFANTDLPPEFKAIIGVFALYNQIECELDNVNISPPLTKMEKRVLVFLDKPKRMGVLAEDTLCVPSAVTPVADALEVRGIVSRTRDPSDRRAWLLELTPEGVAARNHIMTEVVSRFRKFSGMSADEIPTFANLAIKAMPGAVEAGLMED